MSSRYIYIGCIKCTRTEPVYTGDEWTQEFDDADWEGETIYVPKCKTCKESA